MDVGTVYKRLAKAVKRKTGLRLSADDVQALYEGDDAIWRVVEHINEIEEDK